MSQGENVVSEIIVMIMEERIPALLTTFFRIKQISYVVCRGPNGFAADEPTPCWSLQAMKMQFAFSIMMGPSQE